MRDKRRTGEGALNGWATRRRRAAERQAAIARLVGVAQSLTGEVVAPTRVPGFPKLVVVPVETLISWRDSITLAVRILSRIAH